jgi:hypothetical protein
MLLGLRRTPSSSSTIKFLDMTNTINNATHDYMVANNLTPNNILNLPMTYNGNGQYWVAGDDAEFLIGVDSDNYGAPNTITMVGTLDTIYIFSYWSDSTNSWMADDDDYVIG